jgi:hypothetical protein
LMQQRVNERRLAVVDVSDDGDVAPEGIRDQFPTPEDQLPKFVATK